MSKLSGLGGRLYSGETSFDFIGKRRRWYSISALFLLASIGALAVQGLHLGIEFKGGSSYTVNKSGISVEEARASVESVNIPGEIIVQKIGDSKIRIQTGALTSAQSKGVESALTQTFGVAIESIDKAYTILKDKGKVNCRIVIHHSPLPIHQTTQHHDNSNNRKKSTRL